MIEVTIVGNLTKDIELKYSPSGTAIGETSVASKETYKDKLTNEKKEIVTYIDVKFFGKKAEIVNQYLKKGDKVFFKGSYRTDKWLGNDGKNRYTHYVVVDKIEFINCKRDVNVGNGGSNYQQQPYTQNNYQQQQPYTQNNYQQPSPKDINTIDIDTEDIPF